MEALTTLKDQEVLKVLHRREPFPLYEELKHIGYEYHTKKLMKINTKSIFTKNELDRNLSTIRSYNFCAFSILTSGSYQYSIINLFDYFYV